MKTRLLLIACFISVIACGQNEFTSYNQQYFESNFGVAYIEELGSPFPGCSFLIGNRKFTSENIFLDTQIGLAFPSIGTAKIGVGKYNFNKGRASTIGLRIWPTHIYIQQSQATDRCSRKVSKRTLNRLKRRGKTRTNLLCGEWIYSLEAGIPMVEKQEVMGEDLEEVWLIQYNELSLYSIFIVTIGYRIYFD